MKRILLALVIFATAGVCVFALNDRAHRGRQRFHINHTAWLLQTQQLTEVQAQQAVLTTKVRDLKREFKNGVGTASMDPALLGFLLTDDIKSGSLEMQDKILSEFGRGRNSSGSYVLVSKAALTNTTLKPLEAFPNSEKLTDAARGVLAITPEEQQAVEAAFAEAFASVAAWAKANVLREGPETEDDMVVRYTIPVDPAFQQTLTNRLFSTIHATLGEERLALLRRYFEYNRISTDGGISERTNILSIHRLSQQPGWGYRAGWKWSDGSEAINTRPEPIKASRFPTAFRFLFPGGWQEVLKREGFAVSEDLQNK